MIGAFLIHVFFLPIDVSPIPQGVDLSSMMILERLSARPSLSNPAGVEFE
jgi:hypothetical protein